MFQKIIYWFLIGIALIQFIPVDRTKKPVNNKVNFISVFHTPKKIQEILRNSCYDCHSNETVYPDYAYVAPISWTIKNHVSEGREHLNFSEWGTFNQDLKENMLKNSVADLKQMIMPLPAYIIYHPKANLTTIQRTLIINYLEDILKSKKY